MPPKHTLHLQARPLSPGPRRNLLQVPHQVPVVGRIAPGRHHAAAPAVLARDGILGHVAVREQRDQGVDLPGRVAAVLVLAGIFGGLGESLGEDALELAFGAEGVLRPALEGGKVCFAEGLF